MICSRFDYYSPYVLFLCALRLELCGCVCGPTLHFCHKPFFHHSPIFSVFICFLYAFARRSAAESDSSVSVYAFMQFWSDRRCSKEFFMSKMLARAFSGWFSSVRLRQGQVVEG